MNTRKIKLALTVGLLNSESNNNALQSIKDLMSGFRDEVGSFLGLARIKNARLNRNHIKESYKIKFENCILEVDLVLNSITKTQIIQRFQLR